MTKMPIGRDDFADIRQRGEYYSDKTGLLCDLAKREAPYFLSRPRRFGRTLLLNTLEYILRGREDLFKGLEIESRGWDWTPRPVIKLQMNGITSESLEDMELDLCNVLCRIAHNEEINLDAKDHSVGMFEALIESIYKKYGDKKVAILIDEYDKPITRHLNEPNKADAIRKSLAAFYGVLKTKERMRGLALVTGVSRFSKAALLPAFDDLEDLTIGGQCAEICGLTEADLGKLIEGHKDNMLKGLVDIESLPKGATEADLRRLIQDWYGGYSWDGVTRVYNPWSVVNFFRDVMIANYWHKSAIPSFLYNLVVSGKIDFDITKNIKDIKDDDTFINKRDQMNAEGLLFQTGYLTIENMLPDGESYSLRFPNLEVSESLPRLLLNCPPSRKSIDPIRCAKQAVKSLLELDGTKFEQYFREYLNIFPDTTFDIGTKQIYLNLLISCMHAANQNSTACGATSRGRFDLLIEHNKDNYIIEMKVLKLRRKGGGDNFDGPPRGAKEAASDAEAAEIEWAPPKTPEERKALRRRMANLAKKALEQIEARYAPSYANGPGRVIKVALVVAKRTEVHVEIEPSGPRRP